MDCNEGTAGRVCKQCMHWKGMHTWQGYKQGIARNARIAGNAGIAHIAGLAWIAQIRWIAGGTLMAWDAMIAGWHGMHIVKGM